MLKVFFAVVQDLAHFVMEQFNGSKKPVISSKLALPPKADFVGLSSPIQTLTKLPVSINNETEPLIAPGPKSLEGQFGYCLYTQTALHTRPVWTFDGVIKFLPLGREVKILGYEGHFVHILIEDNYGWILKDHVTDKKEDVWPILKTKTTYLAETQETKRIRAIINDEFFTRELYLPLQDVELMTYRLREKGLHIEWGKERPRPAGRWHDLLKGKNGIRIGLEPKAGSVMEIFPSDEDSSLLYITAVHPDESITAQTMGLKEEGVYQELSLVKNVWQLWRPVFIQVS